MKSKYKRWLYYATDPVAFTQDILIKDVPKYHLKDFHRAWLKFEMENRFTVLCAPRGHAKSTIHSAGYVIWRLCHNPNLRVLLLSKSSILAQKLLSEIKWHFEQNQNLIELYGDLTNKNAKWTNEEIMLLRGKNIPYKESSVTARGIESDIIGGHYEIIIPDDIIDDKNSATAAQREKVRATYDKVIRPMLEPWSELHFVGTRWHEFDLYGELMESRMFKHKTYDMIIDEKKKITMWPERLPYDSDDPEQITATSLKREMGTVAFALQYRNDVSQFRNAIFKTDWMQYYVEPPLKSRIYMAVDLAISEKGDYFAIVVIGIDDKGNIYVLDTYYGHHSFHPQLKKIKAYADKWHPIKIGIESNAFQVAVPQELKRNTEEFGFLPIFPIQTTKDKVTRARKLSAFFESGRIYVKKNQIELIDEILNFPKASVPDDVLDALMLTTEIANIRGSFDWSKVASLNRVLNYGRKII